MVGYMFILTRIRNRKEQAFDVVLLLEIILVDSLIGSETLLIIRPNKHWKHILINICYGKRSYTTPSAWKYT